MGKKITYLLTAIVLLLVFTNPSQEHFTSFMHRRDSKNLGRDTNYLVCSIYSTRNNINNTRYFAVLGNFYQIKP